MEGYSLVDIYWSRVPDGYASTRAVPLTPHRSSSALLFRATWRMTASTASACDRRLGLFT